MRPNKVLEWGLMVDWIELERLLLNAGICWIKIHFTPAYLHIPTTRDQQLHQRYSKVFFPKQF
jgi:hypothetical protein